ncbi:GxxExxY protein [Flavobacterium sp.]|uniref:GxxExxY protein n=1 Tax=Flavobacterium sp. TaxID=239 RepID=UPI0039C883B8
MSNFLYKGNTDIILKIFYEVHNVLGYEFLVKLYQNSTCFELLIEELKLKFKNKSRFIYTNDRKKILIP